MKKTSRSNLFLIIILISSFLFWFFLTKNNYFHWDEWTIFSTLKEPLHKLLVLPFGEHFTPATTLNYYFLFRIFGLTYWSFQLMVVLLHLMSSFIIFSVVKRDTGNLKLAYLSLLLFTFSSVTLEMLSWSLGFVVLFASLNLFLAYYFYPKNTFLTAIFLVISPLGHASTLLFPLAFAFKALLERKSFWLYLLALVLNFLILFSFAAHNVSVSLRHEFFLHWPNIPAFIATGVLYNFQHLFLPPLYLFPKSNSQLGLILRPLISLTSLISLIFLFFHFKNSPNMKKLFLLIIAFTPFLLLNYVIISFGRISNGPQNAAISRYTYPTIFFIIILAASIISKLKISLKLVTPLVILLVVSHIIADVNYNLKIWHPIVNRDKQFISDLSYLYDRNSVVLDFVPVSINANHHLSDFWFLYRTKSVTFLPIPSSGQIPSEIVSDNKSLMFYQQLQTTYQQKHD